MRVAIYARVSTTGQQSPEMQLTALRDYCAARNLNIYHEYIDEGISGSKDSRPELNKLMADARKRKFDIVLVWRFDRFARSTRHLINALEEFKSIGINFISFSESIDTSTPMGKTMFTIIAAIAELERNLIRERVIAGLDNARRKGKRLGRPSTPYSREKIAEMSHQGLSKRDIARQLGISHTTVLRVLKEWNNTPKNHDP